MLRRREIIVDSFAGGGGASLGIEQAIGRPVDVAINHDGAAITMHAANHPATKHFTEDVFRAAPRSVTKGRPVGLLWASPDCRHHSRAKGSKPVSKHVRGLAWAVVKWAVEAKPRVIVLENVREFEEWGPVVPRWVCRGCGWKGTEGQAVLSRSRRRCPRCESVKLREDRCDRTGQPHLVPDPSRKGLTFRRFVGRLRNLGYAVEWRNLNASDYGAPTHRRRLFLVARNDGCPINWPEPTHGDPKTIAENAGGLFPVELKPWRTAAECIDWSIPCPSIFERKRPLAEKTLRRIALGIKRYVLDNPKPFIVDMQRGNRPRGVDEPCGTVTTQDNRFNVVTPVVVPTRTHGGGGNAANSADAPLRTVTCTKRGEFAVVAPVVVRTDMHQSNAGCAFAPEQPLNTVTTGGGFGVIAPVITPVTHAGERRVNSPEEPLPTVTGANRGELAVIAPTLVQTGYGEREGQSPRVLDIEAPLGTVVGSQKHALVSAYIAKHFGGQVGCPVDTPLPTTTTRGTQNQVVAANLVHLNHGEKTCSGVDEPARTVTAGGNHAALVYAFLMKYFGSGGQWSAADEPMHTATGKARFGVVTVTIDGQPYAIVDIGMRMLTPRELARAQGFPDSYVLTGTKTNQVERIGNSVCPAVAKAVIAANFTQVPVAA